MDKRSASTISPADGVMLGVAAQIWNCGAKAASKARRGSDFRHGGTAVARA
ncbi:hypothetical protein [uncultured Lamprocystis sp.]|uniref:hypothetical protein n=1 Tax=uncultured Lamprocystis sp. TaxID=543132 RepID=UPI0025DC1125|nr:hypothetical protein [uncultured Lamprocystis sp.]